MSKYFGTDGFRGEANVTLTVDHAFQVGRFLGWYYSRDHKGQIVIGKDTRRSSYMFECALAAGMPAAAASRESIARLVGRGHDDIDFAVLLMELASDAGMTLTPDCDTETLPDDCAGLILVGGMSWATPETERIVPLVREALSHGILVGAICNAASFLAAHGFLNGVRHTGNGLEMLREWGGANYTGEKLYQERQAVRDGNVVTANGSGYLEFTRECLLAREADTPEQIAAMTQGDAKPAKEHKERKPSALESNFFSTNVIRLTYHCLGKRILIRKSLYHNMKIKR